DSLAAQRSVLVGTNPSSVAFLPDGRVVTADRLSDTLSFVTPASGDGPARVDTLTVGRPDRPTPAERGEVLFYSRALVPRNVATGPLSIYTCAACHADGHIDGRRHPSKRNRFYTMTKTCRGLVGTEPFLTIGDPDTFAAFADNIVGTHAQGALDAPDTYDKYPVQLRLRTGGTWTTVTLSPAELRVALAAYMSRIPVEPSPFAPPGRRALSAPERRGLAVFRADCAGCHQLRTSTGAARAVGGAALESRLLAGELVLTSARRYDVGTPVIGEGGNNPPSLRGAWAAAPYFSDGSAATLEEAIRRTDPAADHVHAPANAARPSSLTPAQQADLAAFLRAL
ncbi:MAG TPA: c-type cytochrome, partial [Polyangia bacterium]